MPAGGLRVGFQVWTQFVGWAELVTAGREIADRGFDELWSNDHLVPHTGADGAVLDGPVFEGWGILFAWAGTTTGVRLGCLVSAAGYRNPALLVKMATSLDHASGGRAVLGLGAGWLEREHVEFGIAFGTVGERLDRLTEAAEVSRGLLDGRTVHLHGRSWSVAGARNDPPPVQARLPLLIGGSGERRTLGIVARYADVWNADGDDVAGFRRRNAILDEHCRAIGRDPAGIERTVGLPPPCIRSTRADAVSDLAAILRRHGLSAADARRRATASPFAGPAETVAARLAAYRAAGVSSVIFDWPPPYDLATLDALAGPVRRALEGG